MTYSKTFFGQNRAMAYAAMLQQNGCSNIEVSSSKDGFGQTQYTVRWNMWNEEEE